MQRFFLFVLILSALLYVGCGDDDPGDPNLDPDAEYALDVKKDVFDFAAAWQKNAKSETTKVDLQMLVEKLSAYESMPTGDYEDTYAQLLTEAKDIQSSYDSATSDQVGQFKATAEKLPGDPSTIAYDPN